MRASPRDECKIVKFSSCVVRNNVIEKTIRAAAAPVADNTGRSTCSRLLDRHHRRLSLSPVKVGKSAFSVGGRL